MLGGIGLWDDWLPNGHPGSSVARAWNSPRMGDDVIQQNVAGGWMLWLNVDLYCLETSRRSYHPSLGSKRERGLEIDSVVIGLVTARKLVCKIETHRVIFKALRDNT